MNTVKNYYRYTLSDRLGVLQVKPLGESDFSVEWTREDEEKMDYEKAMPGKITFTGEAFSHLLILEQSIYRCEFISITMERRCGNTWETWFTGRVTPNDGAWDFDRCLVEMEIQRIQPDMCLQDNKGEEINLLATVMQKHTVRTQAPNIIIEKLEYTHLEPGGSPGSLNCGTPYWGGGGTPKAGKWVNYYHASEPVLISPSEGFGCASLSKWARFKTTVATGNPSPGPGWLLVSSSGGLDTYVKEPVLYQCRQYSQNDSQDIPGNNQIGPTQIKECKIVGDEGGLNSIDNGMDLKDVLQAFPNIFCGGMTVRSAFFQINPLPEEVSNINYVTAQENKVNSIVVFQKSDVKRPGAFNNASKANWTWEKLMKNLTAMFNTRWRVMPEDDGFCIRIEHVSWFPQNAGLDLTDQRYARYIRSMKKYSYDKADIPASEQFKFMEATPNSDFAGLPITYTNACVPKTGRTNVKTIAAEDVTTDVNLCLRNPASDSDIVQDAGFVFMACRKIEGQYIILSEPPILQENEELNNTLCWAHLHRDYHRYYRPLPQGNMNGEDTTFLSVKPIRKGQTITVPLCCGDIFNPDEIITTPLGYGSVDKATFHLKDETIELELLYPVTDLTNNNTPVAGNDMETVDKNSSGNIFNVLSNDSDVDNDIEAVEIVLPPINGSAVVLPDKTIQYSPNRNFTGQDVIVYRVRDSWGQPSNNALISIDVEPPAYAFEVVNDNYGTEIDTPLIRTAPAGLLANDITGGVETVVPEIKATEQGGSVQIFADGAFNYNPPSGVAGVDDSFEYTGTDGVNNDSGTVIVQIYAGNTRHTRLSNYSITQGAISGNCFLESFTLSRTSGATADATFNVERVKVVVRFRNNSNCTAGFEQEFIFEPTETVKNYNDGIAVCDIAPGCQAIFSSYVSIEVL